MQCVIIVLGIMYDHTSELTVSWPNDIGTLKCIVSLDALLTPRSSLLCWCSVILVP